ncbi:MAG: serine O-acetyltransferase [Lentisphaeraceae bacterium]|nr:serine O-acetyltransferase [Lentisphaeraceae bacterium]
MSQTLWSTIIREAKKVAAEEPSLVSLIHETIINQPDFAHALAFHLSGKFQDQTISAVAYNHLFNDIMAESPCVVEASICDLKAIKQRDPATKCYVVPMLYFKGFLALQVSRLSNCLWKKGRKMMACHIQSRNSEIFSVDIHPGATIGKGILLDHASSFVCGETASIGNNVSILHEVTLGGSGKESGDRHPKVGSNVLIGAGAKLLGNIKIGDGAKIGAGSVVLEDVPPHTTVAGVPAKQVGKPSHKNPSKFMEHILPPECSQDFQI